MKIVYTQNQTEPLLQKSLKRAAPLRSIEIALFTHVRSFGHFLTEGKEMNQQKESAAAVAVARRSGWTGVLRRMASKAIKREKAIAATLVGDERTDGRSVGGDAIDIK